MNLKFRYLLAGVMLTSLLPNDNVSAMAVRHEGTFQQHKDLALEFPTIAVFGKGDGAGFPVADRWVLTAAHVAESLPHTGNKMTYAGQGYQVASIYLHPQWSPVNQYDLALLELTAAIPDLIPVRLSTGQEFAGQQVIFVGAGDFAKGDGSQELASGTVHAARNILDRVDGNALYFDLDAAPDAVARVLFESAGDIKLSADPVRLGQVTSNLINNAFTHGGDQVSVSVRTRIEENAAVLEVSDNGPGIPESAQEHVFERFYQAEASRSGGQSGAGLGLAVVKSLVEAQGGSVTFLSQPGKTRFMVRFPMS